MAKKTTGYSSTCTQHPGFDAIGRCKQCGKPFCSQCQVKGPTGLFCCENCKKMHEAFTQKAMQLDSMTKTSSMLTKLTGFVKQLIAWIILALFIAAIAHYVFNVEVPVISEWLRSVSPE